MSAGALVVVAGLTLGSPVDQLGFTSAGAGLAGSTVARPTGGSIVTYNPALAASSDDAQFVIGYSVAALDFNINDEGHGLDDARAVHFGIIIPLSLGSFGRLGASFGFSVPDERLLRPRVLALDRPRFLMYDNRLQRTDIEAALAYAIAFGEFELGLAGGVTALSGAAGQGVTFHLVENGDYSSADAAVRARLPIAVAPVVAAYFRWRQLHAGLLFRGEMAFDVSVGTAAEIELGGIAGDVYTAVSSLDFYTPPKIAAGLAWTGDTVEIHVALETYLWSLYRDDVTVVTNIDFEGLGIDIPVGSAVLEDEFVDTFSPRLGVQWRLPSLSSFVELVLRAGAFYESSPVASSSLRLDSERVGGSFGVGIATTGPLWAFPRPLSLDAHFMVFGLVPRTYASEGAAAAYPDLAIDGLVYAGGATFTARF